MTKPEWRVTKYGEVDMKFGRELTQVDEPPYRGSTTVIFELEAYPEPKSLSPDDLKALYLKLGTNKRVAAHIGTSTNFVRGKRSTINPLKSCNILQDDVPSDL